MINQISKFYWNIFLRDEYTKEIQSHLSSINLGNSDKYNPSSLFSPEMMRDEGDYYVNDVDPTKNCPHEVPCFSQTMNWGRRIPKKVTFESLPRCSWQINEDWYCDWWRYTKPWWFRKCSRPRKYRPRRRATPYKGRNYSRGNILQRNYRVQGELQTQPQKVHKQVESRGFYEENKGTKANEEIKETGWYEKERDFQESFPWRELRPMRKLGVTGIQRDKWHSKATYQIEVRV